MPARSFYGNINSGLFPGLSHCPRGGNRYASSMEAFVEVRGALQPRALVRREAQHSMPASPTPWQPGPLFHWWMAHFMLFQFRAQRQLRQQLRPTVFLLCYERKSELEMLVFCLLTRVYMWAAEFPWLRICPESQCYTATSQPPEKALWLLILTDKGIEPKRVPRLVQLTTGKWQL